MENYESTKQPWWKVLLKAIAWVLTAIAGGAGGATLLG